MLVLKYPMNELGCSATECCMDGTRMEADIHRSYLFIASILAVEAADVCLVVDANPCMEVLQLNTRLRKAYINWLEVALIGHDDHLKYDQRTWATI